jgi:hypothetical protein
MTRTTRTKGVSLAKGPVGLLGMLALIYGITAVIFGGHSFTTHALGGTVNGKTWLGLEVNAWSSLLFIGAGALLLFGAPLHWGAKTISLIVGLALGAACLLALVDGHDVLGIFAANGLTKLAWGAAAAVLLVLALLPRVGGQKDPDADPERARSQRRARRQARDVERVPTRDREPRFERDTAPAGEGTRSRREGGRVVAPAAGTTAESRGTTRRRQNGDI